MTKGADSIMLPRIKFKKEEVDLVNSHLDEFACQGLRTLVMGQKLISETKYNKWRKIYDKT